MNHPDVAPGFVAAKAGYDVWFGNSRGNNMSPGHKWLNPKTQAKQYWDFGWQEMGTLDLKPVLNLITTTTGYPKVAYVGHSQGTT